ncbi:head decoration protein [Enterobacter sp. JMULE2]|uniref:head decoration protein n=1 Tax=Enterobacter sp. JMULE2 TaxID=2518340 RepID=UPI0015757436|nr:head decoration protein [Enterobacter sp. JMULE2]NTZ38149.1 head decoration protein [Enterobacter sp. JMULE2]
MGVPYPEIYSGTAEVSTTLVCLSGSGSIPQFTPLMIEPTSGLMTPWDGVNAGAAVYLTCFNIESNAQSRAQVYKTGTFNVDIVNWPESVTTLEKKLSAFAGSALSVQPLAG